MNQKTSPENGAIRIQTAALDEVQSNAERHVTDLEAERAELPPPDQNNDIRLNTMLGVWQAFLRRLQCQRQRLGAATAEPALVDVSGISLKCLVRQHHFACYGLNNDTLHPSCDSNESLMSWGELLGFAKPEIKRRYHAACAARAHGVNPPPKLEEWVKNETGLDLDYGKEHGLWQEGAK